MNKTEYLNFVSMVDGDCATCGELVTFCMLNPESKCLRELKKENK